MCSDPKSEEVHFLSVWNPRGFADDTRWWQSPFVLCLHPHADVADEGLHGAQQLLVPLQLLRCREGLAALLAGPQVLGGRAGFGRLLLGILRRLLFDLDLQRLGEAEVLGEAGGVFGVKVHRLRAAAAPRGVVFGGSGRRAPNQWARV